MSCASARPSAGSLSATPSGPRGAFLLHTFIILAAISSIAANFGSSPSMLAGSHGGSRSRNFAVSAPTPQFARQVCAAAERFRRELAIEWLGRELPPWPAPCPIRVIVGSHLGAGGATSFTFINGQPRNWDMEIQGSGERILDSVLPHEVTHTILATHFGRPLPRWADEGAATSVEGASERNKQDKLLIQFLTTNRGIAFNHMFAMKEYPRDILPLYSQGYSLARFLIAQGGKRRFVDYVGDGMRWNNWTAATQKHYSLRSLSELQLTWLDWVRQGSPDTIPDVSLVSHTQPTRTSDARGDRVNAAPSGTSGLVPLPSPVAPHAQSATSAGRSASTSAILVTSPRDGWYSRRRDEAMSPAGESAAGSTPTKQRVGRASVE